MTNTVDEYSRVEKFACKTYLPPLELYYSEYSLALKLSLTVGCIIWLWVTFVFVRVIRLIKKHTGKDQVMVLMIANTVYLIVVTFSVLALLLPHVAVVCDIVPFVAFCWCILVFFRYLKQSVGGDSVIIALYESKQLDAPQVCPCFRIILDRKKQLEAIRIGILQFPIYNSIVASIQLLIFTFDKNLFFEVFYYILPFVIASIVCYVVSSISFIKTVAPLYPDNPIFKRFFLLQLVLLITKPQIIILELIYNFMTFECTIAGEPKAYFNILKQMIILVQVGLVTVFSYKFYTAEQTIQKKAGVQNDGFEA
ncbi:uncharacterized protein LOC131289719 [Anopheles ziemanni]|uniref:uncharacterized protein LOC131259766 n=1 Tax=Anopheles coustani TaxID=139045 RepID=UPI002658249E|nr:uncharacterized protein LOC131259766 [Anopheles coustani]XP_058175004.1 uncharacterized protein LOC131289719 [Anopheles ziemanni]